VVDALAARQVPTADIRRVLLAEAAAVRLTRIATTREAIASVDAGLALARTRRDDASVRLARATDDVGAATDTVARLRLRLSALARDAFMRVATDDDGLLAALRSGTRLESDRTTVDARRARVYAGHAAAKGGSDLRAAEQLLTISRATESALQAEVATVDIELAALATAAATARTELATLEATPVDVPAASPTADPAAVAAAQQAAAGAEGPTILGPTVLGAEDLAAFVLSRSRPHPSIDLEALARHFVDEGAAEGVRADLAWAQSIIETGYFGFAGSMVDPADHNYAGIGACDSCSRGHRYATPELGARAQIQLLRTYADPTATSATLARPPAGRAPEQVYVRGCCATWMALSGVWATGPGYGRKILTVYADMLAFAAARRAAA
jgi:hypothetical protein